MFANNVPKKESSIRITRFIVAFAIEVLRKLSPTKTKT